MRTPLLIALALAAVALGFVSLRMGDTQGGPELGLPSSDALDAAVSSSPAPSQRVEPATLAQATSEPEVALPTAETSGLEDLAGRDAPRALEGLVRDRFGNPVRERVLLLAPGQPHPSEGADLTKFVTAVSSREGRFSLSLPSPGPWRLGVGAPGAPRLNPTEPRTLDGTLRAEVVLSGTAALAVVFEEPPAGERVRIEVETLREDVEGGRGRGGERAPDARGGGRRGGTGRGNFDRGNVDRGTSLGDPGGRGGPREDTGDEEGTRDRRGAALAPATAPVVAPAWASPVRAIFQDPELGRGGGGGRRGSGERPERTQNPGGRTERQDRQRSRGEPEPLDDAPAGPPPEVWRSQERRTVEGAELAAGRVEFSALPAGPVARLVLSIGDERYEGVARFTLAADARVEVRVLPVVAGSGALTYLTSTTPLGPDESPAGVTWVE